MATKETEDFSLPSNDADRKKIKDALYEIVGALQFIADKREFIKDVADVLKENYKMPRKIVNKMAKTLHKQNYSDVAHENDLFDTCFEVLFQGDDSSEPDSQEDYS